MIRCPSCANGIQCSERGCSTFTCRSAAHRGSGSFFYLYFCFHCRSPREGGEGYCANCPGRNSRITRQRVRAERDEDVRALNEAASANPIELE